MMQRAPVQERPQKDACYFYHFFDLRDGSTVSGPTAAYDLRGQFLEYIGNVDVRGKTVLDFGTASGFLALSAEAYGASKVTAFETSSLFHQQRVPFANSLYLRDKNQWAVQLDPGFRALQNGFWYMWHEYQSAVEIVYGSDRDLMQSQETFDIVFAGAVIEHLSDPVTVLGLLARMTGDTLVLAFTPVFLDDDEYMKPLTAWNDEGHSYVWWALSRGLYERVLGNLGFDLRFVPVSADIVDNGVRTTIPRQTIVASRR